MYEKAGKKVKKTAKQIVENLEGITQTYTGEKFAQGKKNVKKATNQIVENLDSITKGQRKGKEYLKSGKGAVDIKIGVGTDANENLEEYMEKAVKKAKTTSKKVKANIDVK